MQFAFTSTTLVASAFPMKAAICPTSPPIFSTSKGNRSIMKRHRSKDWTINAASLKPNLVYNYIPSTDSYQLEEAIKKIKTTMAKKSREHIDADVEELVMIDAIQRLGLDYYFPDDIDAALKKHYVKFCSSNKNAEGGGNLHDVALRFRLLRQAGYHVSADPLKKFKDKDGKFKQAVEKDIKGLMSLFEASQLNTQGDYMLDEAVEISGQLLKASTKNIKHFEAMIIGNTLCYPHHKSLPRLMAKNFLPNFKTSLKFFHGCNDINDDWIDELENLARIDINMARISHEIETTQVSRWWNELQLADELQVARNTPLKWHMWSLALLPGPNMAQQRIELTKPISLIYIIDDIFDVYATLEELTLFTEAINRWEYEDVEGLPNCMKIVLKTLHDITNETSHMIYMKHGWNPKDYLKKAWADLCNAFLVEARWFASGELPTTKEYLKNGIVSSGVDVLFVYVFSLLGEDLNPKTIGLFNNHPKIVSSTATIFRLWDDLGSAKDENQDGHDGSFIACYMNEHQGSSAEVAQEHVLSIISNAWKCLNKECLSNSPFSADFRAACLNMARMIPIMYNYNGTHQLPIIDKHKNIA